MSDRTIEDLRYLQALPLEMKVEMTKARIREWVAVLTMITAFGSPTARGWA